MMLSKRCNSYLNFCLTRFFIAGNIGVKVKTVFAQDLHEVRPGSERMISGYIFLVDGYKPVVGILVVSERGNYVTWW
jgi:hypothetical protein